MSDDKPLQLIAETAAKAAVALLVPGGGIINIVYDAGRKQISKTTEEICEQAGPDAVIARLEHSATFAALMLNALDVAARTGFERKRHLMARVVANALTDEATIEEGDLIVRALRDLDAPHFRALGRMRIAEQSVPDTEDPALDAYNRINPVMQVSVDESEAIVAALLRTGTVVAIPSGAQMAGRSVAPPRVGGLSTFGRKLLMDLER